MQDIGPPALQKVQNINARLLQDLTTVVDRLDEKVQSFQSRKRLDRSKAIISHYGLQSRLQNLRLGSCEYSLEEATYGEVES